MKRLALALIPLVMFACGGPSTDYRTKYQRSGTYPITGDFKEPVASLVIERNGRFDITAAMGSSCLMDRQEGLLLTAKHVTMLDTEYKIFLAGRVYGGRRVLDPGVTDVSFVKISKPFDPAQLPEPYPLGDNAKKGDRVFVRGIHMHPESLQEGKIIHRITEGYYGIHEREMVNGKVETREFVYDNLPAHVDNTKKITRNSDIEGMERNGLENVAQNQFVIKTDNDHVFSFSGLSGGCVVDENGRIVGITNTEEGGEGETILERNGLFVYHPKVTINMLPSEELKRAIARMR